MSTSKQSRHAGRHRADDLPVRRWLQLGAASAGMSAALIGWLLVGSEVGVASADSSVASSSAGPAGSPSKGVHSGSKAPSPSGRPKTVASRAHAADTPSQVVSRSNRVAAAEPSSVADRRTATTNGELARTLQGPSTRFLGGPGAGPLPVVMASRGDPLGALGKFFTSLIKEGLKSKTIANPVQRLDGKLPGLLDFVPKIPVPSQDSTWAREVQARNAKNQQRTDEKSRQIDEIVQKGVKLTARDGSPVYSIDGKTYVKYNRVFANGPPQPILITLSNQLSERNRDIVIRNNLKLDPATVRKQWGA